MKFEYVPSTFGINPDLLIAGTEFKKAWKNEEEFSFIFFVVDAFASGHGFDNNLRSKDYQLTYRWLKKNSSNILFVVKEDNSIRSLGKRWCEIYVVTDGKIQGVVTSEDGENFTIKQPDK